MKNHEPPPLISICLCTYKRPELLNRCLKSILDQSIQHSFEVILIDNDALCSGKKIFEKIKPLFDQKGKKIEYLVEPIQNIALARNRCVKSAIGEIIAFIDDDEIATPNWLNDLYKTLIETNSDGVWGPVIPLIPKNFPEWMRRSKIFDRPQNPNRSIVEVKDLRSGNALIKRSLLSMRTGPFDEAFGRIGGSDWRLFCWLKEKGSMFIWDSNAIVYEYIEEKRRYFRWHFIRGYRGGWVYSSKLVEDKGYYLGLCLCIARIPPLFVRALIHFVISISNPKTAALILLKEICGYLGKLSYFLKIRIEEYK